MKLSATSTIPAFVLLASLSARAGAATVEAYGKLPLTFEANRGQTDPNVRFLARGDGYALFLTSSGAVLRLREAVLRMELVGANGSARISGIDQQPGRSHYFIGNDPARWRRDVPHFAKVRYEDAWPGVDLVYYGNPRQLEFDFVVKPGADLGAIHLDFDGARTVAVDGGALVLELEGGNVRLQAPLIYQESGGRRQTVAGGYVLKGAKRVGFAVAPHDERGVLVIDPVLSYSTYLGGSSTDGG